MRARLAPPLVVTGSAVWVISVVLLLIGLTDPWPSTMWFPRGPSYVLTVALLLMGGLVARRRPDNPIGWALVVAGIFGAAQGLAAAIVVLAHADGADALGAWAAWVVESLWPSFVVALAYVVARFPGTASQRGDRVATVLAAIAVVSVTLNEMLVAGPFQNVSWYDNPVQLVPASAAETVESVVFLPLVALLVLSLVQVSRRARRARGVERQQFRWVLYGAIPQALSMVVLPFSGIEEVSASHPLVAMSTIGLTLIPVTIGVAILRYRLYDLDRIVSRTVAYVLLTGAVVGVWALVALAPTVLFDVSGPDGEPNSVLVAGGTLVAALSFNPLRARVQDAIDRRLNRARYDARHAIERLGTQLADRVDPAEVRTEIAGALSSTLAPATVAVWTPAPREEHV